MQFKTFTDINVMIIKAISTIVRRLQARRFKTIPEMLKFDFIHFVVRVSLFGLLDISTFVWFKGLVVLIMISV